MTGLIVASQNGHEAVVRLLLQHGADINAANKVLRGGLGRAGGGADADARARAGFVAPSHSARAQRAGQGWPKRESRESRGAQNAESRRVARRSSKSRVAEYSTRQC